MSRRGTMDLDHLLEVIDIQTAEVENKQPFFVAARAAQAEFARLIGGHPVVELLYIPWQESVLTPPIAAWEERAGVQDVIQEDGLWHPDIIKPFNTSLNQCATTIRAIGAGSLDGVEAVVLMANMTLPKQQLDDKISRKAEAVEVRFLAIRDDATPAQLEHGDLLMNDRTIEFAGQLCEQARADGYYKAA